MFGRDSRQRRRRLAAAGAAGIAAKKHHDAKQAKQPEEEAVAQQPAAEPSQASPAAGLTTESMDQLKELGELHDQNVLSDQEFEREKAKLLGPT